MAKIIQALTRASKEYDPVMLSSLVRDLDKLHLQVLLTLEELTEVGDGLKAEGLDYQTE